MAMPASHPLTLEPLLRPRWHPSAVYSWRNVHVLEVAGDWLKLQPLGDDYHPLPRPGWVWVPASHLGGLEPVYD